MVTNGVWDVPIKSDVMRGKDKPVYVSEQHNLICSHRMYDIKKIWHTMKSGEVYPTLAEIFYDLKKSSCKVS